jgi:hypothetical protein
MMATETPQRRIKKVFHVPPLEPIRLLRKIQLEPRVFWTLGLAFCWIVAIFFAVVLHFPLWWGGLITAAILVIYFAGLHRKPYENRQKTRMAIYYRKASRAAKRAKGKMVYTLEDTSAPESFGADSQSTARGQPKRSVRPSAPKVDMIGPITFPGHPLRNAEGAQVGEMGVAMDNWYRTASVSLKTYNSSVLPTSDEVVMQRFGAYANLTNVIGALGPVARYYTWRDTKFRGQNLNGHEILRQVREGANLPPVKSLVDDLFDERVRKEAAKRWVHRTIHTLTADLPSIGKKINSRGGIGPTLEDAMTTFYKLGAAGVDEGNISPQGWETARVLNRRDLITDMRLVLDPVFMKGPWQADVAGPTGPYLDEYDAYPGWSCFDEEVYPEWKGCIKNGKTYRQGLYLRLPRASGLTAEGWWELLSLDITRTVVVVKEIMPQDIALWRARMSRVGRSKEILDAEGDTMYQAFRDQEYDIARGDSTGAFAGVYVDVFGETPDEVNAYLGELTGLAYKLKVLPAVLSNRQHKIVNAVLPTGRGLRLPTIPRWIRLLWAASSS